MMSNIVDNYQIMFDLIDNLSRIFGLILRKQSVVTYSTDPDFQIRDFESNQNLLLSNFLLINNKFIQRYTFKLDVLYQPLDEFKLTVDEPSCERAYYEFNMRYHYCRFSIPIINYNCNFKLPMNKIFSPSTIKNIIMPSLNVWFPERSHS